MTAHPQAGILMEIAKEAQINPKPHKEWQYKGRVFGEWLSFDRLDDLFVAAASGAYPMRRKPRTIRVSGEVAYEVINLARGAISDYSSAKGPERTLARALLSLMESPEPEDSEMTHTKTDNRSKI